MQTFCIANARSPVFSSKVFHSIAKNAKRQDGWLTPKNDPKTFMFCIEVCIETLLGPTRLLRSLHPRLLSCWSGSDTLEASRSHCFSVLQKTPTSGSELAQPVWLCVFSTFNRDDLTFFFPCRCFSVPCCNGWKKSSGELILLICAKTIWCLWSLGFWQDFSQISDHFFVLWSKWEKCCLISVGCWL